MTPGLSNIPAFNLTLSDDVTVTLEFPSTVRTAEEGALPDEAFTGATVTFTGDPEIKLPAGVLVSDVFGSAVGVSTSVVSETALELVVYYGGFTLLSSMASVDLTDLRQTLIDEGLTIAGYRLEFNINYPRLARVYIYTSDGLYGYATPYIPSTYTFPDS
jgi:hypothetical protein